MVLVSSAVVAAVETITLSLVVEVVVDLVLFLVHGQIPYPNKVKQELLVEEQQ